MPSTEFNRHEFYAELEQYGVDEVRARLASGIYGNVNEKGALARDWVLRKEQSLAAAVERKRLEISNEQLRIARSAKNAAWAAAIAAIIAAIIATVAALISYLSLK